MACFLGRLDVADELRGDGGARRTIPSFAFPEGGGARARAASPSSPPGGRGRSGEVSELSTTSMPDAARTLVAARLADHDGDGAWLDEADVEVLLHSFGIPTVEARRVPDAGGAAAAADELGYPVALKVGSAEIVHKTDVGGVALGLASATRCSGRSPRCTVASATGWTARSCNAWRRPGSR